MQLNIYLEMAQGKNRSSIKAVHRAFYEMLSLFF